MSNLGQTSKRKRQLRWKLTLSYTAVTVGALLFVEFILYLATVAVLAFMINTGFLGLKNSLLL